MKESRIARSRRERKIHLSPDAERLVASALVPHKFVTLGAYRAHHIHANDRFVTEWLE